MRSGAPSPTGRPGSAHLLTPEELGVAVFLVLLILLLLYGAWAEGQRPVVGGNLEASLPAPGKDLRLTASNEAPATGVLTLQLRALEIVGFPSEGTKGGDARHRVELVIPVPSSACGHWQRQVGTGCEKPLRVKGAPLTLTWRGVKVMRVGLQPASRWSLRAGDPLFAGQLPASWSLESEASATTSVPCIESTGFELTLAGETFRSRCALGGRRLRLLLVGEPGQMLSLGLHGVRAMRGHGRAGAVGAVVERGTAVAEDRERSVNGLEKVSITASSGAVRMGLRTTGDFWAKARTTDTVEVDGDNVVSTRFEKTEALWWGLVGSLVIASLTAGLALYRSVGEGKRD